MRNLSLLTLCIIGSGAGIACLYIISFFLLPMPMQAGEITKDDIGMKVSVKGVVEDLRRHSSGHIFFSVRDSTGSISAVIWDERAEQLKLSGINLTSMKEGMSVSLTGDVELYNGRLQITV